MVGFQAGLVRFVLAFGSPALLHSKGQALGRRVPGTAVDQWEVSSSLVVQQVL